MSWGDERVNRRIEGDEGSYRLNIDREVITGRAGPASVRAHRRRPVLSISYAGKVEVLGSGEEALDCASSAL